jgi:hypothetical protein
MAAAAVNVHVVVNAEPFAAFGGRDNGLGGDVFHVVSFRAGLFGNRDGFFDFQTIVRSVI